MRIISTDMMRGLCLEHNWFTSGSIEQYEKLMHMVREHESLERIALAIWICSNNLDADIYEESKILRELNNALNAIDEPIWG